MADSGIVRIEWAALEGRRPRPAGGNARLGPHGDRVGVPLARVTLRDGSAGFGVCRAPRRSLEALLGLPLEAVFSPQDGVPEAWLACEYPVWDLAARRAGVPVYTLASKAIGVDAPSEPQRVRCYDTSLYFDDLHLPSDEAAAELLASEAREGYEAGHRAFKLKVGRGAKHMPPEDGLRRDIAVVRAVREAVGADSTLMLDANDGLTLNLTKRLLSETAACAVYWIEEPFREDAVLLRDLREWLVREELPVLIADGEGEAASGLLEWARDGLLDVVQYDVFAHGFSRWLSTGRTLYGWGVRTAPHHYGGHLGNYYACHLAPAVRGFAFAEWDEATTPGIAAPGYAIREGRVEVPADPGFGLVLDEELFRRAVGGGGYELVLAPA